MCNRYVRQIRVFAAGSSNTTYVLAWKIHFRGDAPVLHRVESYFYQLTREVGHFDQHQWMVVIALVIVVGVFLLRGHGFRSY